MEKITANKKLLIGFGIAFVVLIILGVVAYLMVNSNKSASDKVQTTSNPETTSAVLWEFNGEKWQASDTPPTCPDPLKIASPTDISKVTNILYPGQTRGGDYKPHGGFRFNNSSNSEITVTIPMDSQLVKMSRYIQDGEIQYFLVFTAPCGIAYRFDHLLTLTPEFQSVADRLPEAKVNDSRTTAISPPLSVKEGNVVATSVGFTKTENVSFDFGVYNLRDENSISADPTWSSQHAGEKEFAFYGICWFDLLPSADAATVKSLPAGDATNGKTSDYCK